jgi:hypothetical protein
MPNLVVALAVVLLTAVPGWTQSDLQPAAAEATSADLESEGLRNGRMPDHRLIEVEGCRLERDAAYAFALMSDAARVDGITLQPGDCYRSYEAQSSARARRCDDEVREVTALDAVTGEVTVVSRETVTVCEGPPTAPAGSSNHGWGRAIDFVSMQCGDTTFAWLQERASEFGWVHPSWAECGRSTQEPWHWEWAGVEPVPPILSGLAFEGSDAFPRSLAPRSRVR